MLNVENLKKDFGSFHAVKGVSFTVGKGEVLGFLGPNGAGKSTTMRMITGFIPPTSGTATICGHDILQDPVRLCLNSQTESIIPDHLQALPRQPQLLLAVHVGIGH